jgi:hypothetical protein
MKIKQDFITNSSSTCYLIYIPDNFKIGTELSWLDYIFRPKACKYFAEFIEEIMTYNETNSSEYFSYSKKDLSRDSQDELRNMISRLAQKYEVSKTVIEGGLDDVIVNINSKNIKINIENIKERK